MLSGFRVSGYLNRKKVINYPVQGTAFHALLWCLIRISYLLKKYKMKTKLIGQIHDDAVSDVPEKELSNYIEIALDVITVQLKKHWPWIITPMQVEIETTPIDGSWYEKKLWEG
jgi:DNA polymerase I-like protein with 3'-5' exonuclease and polymerase domains